MNPYYSRDSADFCKFTFEEDLGYEFNILLFVKTGDGRVYSAEDCGCSCPSPFEDYEAETLDGVLQKMERIGSVEQAMRIFDSWRHRGHKKSPIVPSSDFEKLRAWMGVIAS